MILLNNQNNPFQNNILTALPTVEYESFSDHLELVHLPIGKFLYEPDQELNHAYFPTSAIISLHYVLASGASAETAGVGNEGVLGVSLFMGGNTTSSSAVVQTAGYAYRLDKKILKREFDRSGIIQRVLLRYTQALMTQMSQTAVCNRHHALEQQLCRWLLLTLDRSSSNELVITHGLVASMLGVYREGVSIAASKLQQAGVISYRRGLITVLDRAKLESRTCECYAVVRKELDRLLADGLLSDAKFSLVKR